ncbi:MAG: bifunctional hydroxymethylpyrimidine kinase/phosphomethylpyrimidine kinase [Pseudomonadota bacterium]
MTPKVLSIAGSDPSGGAGIQADLKTFSALGVYGMSVITALTAQNTKGVSAVEMVAPEFLRAQLEAIFDDIAVHAIKIGMIGTAENAHVIADILEKYKPSNVVLDPVMVATSGDSLVSNDAVEAIKTRLIPLADVITPNISEAEKLSRKAVLDMERAAKDLIPLGAKAVFLKGGHLKGEEAIDVLATPSSLEIFSAPRVLTSNTHGTGCTLSSAIAARLAHGDSLAEACGAAKAYLTGALKAGDTLGVGHGNGPVHHFWETWS